MWGFIPGFLPPPYGLYCVRLKLFHTILSARMSERIMPFAFIIREFRICTGHTVVAQCTTAWMQEVERLRRQSRGAIAEGKGVGETMFYTNFKTT